MKNLIKFIIIFSCFGLGCNRKEINQPSLPLTSHVPEDVFQTTYIPTYTSRYGDIEDNSIQCPVPMKDRVANHTGIQCVWSSIEMLGRWAEEPKLTNPPLTSRSDCKSYAGPGSAARKLNELGVRFEQTTNRQEGLEMIKKAMEDGRGCLWGVPHHAMVLVHYDEQENIVKWVDNSDRSLKIQTCTVEVFKKRWTSWVLVIYADNDIILIKTRKIANRIPILNHNKKEELPKGYIPIPKLSSPKE